MIDNVIAVGMRAALAAGALLLEGRSTMFQVGSKANRQDLVTEFDRRAEDLIVSQIREVFPSHSILAEESGETNGDPRYQWVIDPLDGTMNFAHRYPLFSVSIAFKVDGVTEWGAVHVPALGEMYSARRGQGAYLGDRLLKVSTVAELPDALITTGFPTTKATDPDNNLAEVNAVVPHIADLRRSGSAAFDLAQVACGRIDAFWEYGLSAWDVAAGALLVEEAGGRIGIVRDDAPPKKTGLLASNGLIHDALHGLMRRAIIT